MNWAQFALHYGDWEHVTVRISEDTTTLIGVYYSQHGNAQYVTNPSLDGTHPIVYPGWNSHAKLPGFRNEYQHTDSGFSRDHSGKLVEGSRCHPLIRETSSTTTSQIRSTTNGVQWKPWQDTSQLVLLDNNATAMQWLSFNGNWGPTVTNTIDHPPTLPSGASDELYVLAQGGSFLGLLQKYVVASGPLGPEACRMERIQ